MMHKRFIVLLGVVLSSYVPAAAQRPTQQIAIAHEPPAPAITIPTIPLRTLPVRLPVFSFFLFQRPTLSSARFTLPVVQAYGRDSSLEDAFPIESMNTMFFTESRVSVGQIWGGRLQLNCFVSTLRMGNIVLGPSVSRAGLLPPGTRSLDQYGISLRFPFGAGADSEPPAHLWRTLSRIVGRQ
jgi:hypothetical protein